jgi:hypothetical protein
VSGAVGARIIVLWLLGSKAWIPWSQNARNAAFLKARSEAEFALYAGILNRDRDFADIRYWCANQKQWVDGDRAG